MSVLEIYENYVLKLSPSDREKLCVLIRETLDSPLTPTNDPLIEKARESGPHIP